MPMNPMAIMKTICHLNPDALFVDGFDSALIGCSYCGPAGRTVAVYDRDKCIDLIIEQDNLPYTDAVEHFEFNIEGAHVGKSSPLFVTVFGSEIEVIFDMLDEEDE